MITLRHAENEEEFEDTVVAKAVAMTVLCVVSLTMGLINQMSFVYNISSAFTGNNIIVRK